MIISTLGENSQFNIVKNKQVLKKSNREAFGQNFPSPRETQEYKNTPHSFDYSSGITEDQSLSREQIARGQTKVIDEKLDSLSQKYEIAESEGVKSFLLKNRFLISLLEEIPNKVSQYFGNNQRLALKVSYEPDFPESSELWVFILTELSAKEALPLLEKFDEEWWLENMDRADCKLNITLKFV